MLTGNVYWVLALGVFIYFTMRRGGGYLNDQDRPDRDRQGQKEHLNAGWSETPSTSVGTSRDPVCGMAVAVDGEAPSSEHRGQSFRFCSEQCRKLFDLNPGKYAPLH